MAESNPTQVILTDDGIKIIKAQNTADNATSGVTDLNDPNLMSVIEKQNNITQFAGLTSQYNVIVQNAKDDGIDTTAVTTAYNNLNQFMASVLADPNHASDVDRVTYKKYQDAYNKELSNLQNALQDNANNKFTSAASATSQAASMASQAFSAADSAYNYANSEIAVNSMAIVKAQSTADNAFSQAQAVGSQASSEIAVQSTATAKAQSTADNAFIQATTAIDNGKVTSQAVTDLKDGSKLTIAELENGLATKVANSDYASYKEQTASQIGQMVTNDAFSTYKTQTADLISSKVATKDFSAYQATTAKSINSKVESSDFNTYKTQTADAISSKVSTADFNNLTISNRNLALGTATAFTMTGNGSKYMYSLSSTIAKGTTVTVAYDITSTNATGTYTSQFAGGSYQGSTVLPLTTGPQHQSYTMVTGTDYSNGIQMRLDNSTATVTVSNLIISESSKEVSWTPAPEDQATQSQITQLSGEIEQKVDSGDFSTYKIQTAQLIGSKVDNGDFSTYKTQTASQIASKVDNGDFSAYQATTANAISSKVESNDFNTYKTQTDSAISSKVSTADYNSQVTQLNNAINLKVAKGDLIDQINIQAGNTLISSSGQLTLSGKNIYFDTSNPVIIPSANIDKLLVDKKLTAADISANTFTTNNGTFTVDKNGAVVASNLTIRGVTNLVYNAALLGANGSYIPGWDISNNGVCWAGNLHDGVPSIGFNASTGSGVLTNFAQTKLHPLNGATGQPFSASVWFKEYGSDTNLIWNFTLAFFDSNGNRIDGGFVGQTWNGIGSEQDWRYVTINNAVAPSNAVSVGLQYWAYNGHGNACFSSPMLTQTAQATGYQPDTGNVISAGEIDGSVINGSTINTPHLNLGFNGTFTEDFDYTQATTMFLPKKNKGTLTFNHGVLQSKGNMQTYVNGQWGGMNDSLVFQSGIDNSQWTEVAPGYIKFDLFKQNDIDLAQRTYTDPTGFYYTSATGDKSYLGNVLQVSQVQTPSLIGKYIGPSAGVDLLQIGNNGKDYGLQIGNYYGAEGVLSDFIYNVTSSGSSNVHITENGRLVRSTSASKYKYNIKNPDIETTLGDRLLNVHMATWNDKRAVDMYAEQLSTGEEREKSSIDKYYGLIAEQLRDAGLDMFINYGKNHEIEGIQYDRAWIPLLSVIRRLSDKVNEYELRLSKLEGASK